jgi:hypothetical protein
VADQTSQDTGRPYSQLEQDGYILREFSKETTSLELVWHRDKVDRYVEPVKESDWLFQLDNDIPRKLGKNKLFIPKETYHRLIKGTGDLIVKIWEVNET